MIHLECSKYCFAWIERQSLCMRSFFLSINWLMRKHNSLTWETSASPLAAYNECHRNKCKHNSVDPTMIWESKRNVLLSSLRKTPPSFLGKKSSVLFCHDNRYPCRYHDGYQKTQKYILVSLSLPICLQLPTFCLFFHPLTSFGTFLPFTLIWIFL